jgi:hypothetical protein
VPLPEENRRITSHEFLSPEQVEVMRDKKINNVVAGAGGVSRIEAIALLI